MSGAERRRAMSRSVLPKAKGWWVAASLVAMAVMLLPWPAHAQQSPQQQAAATADTAVRCKIGLYIIDLHDLDIRKKLFDADFWLWSLCPTNKIDPLKSVEFINSNHIATSLDQAHPREGVSWTAKKVDGTFRHDWNVRAYPFDQHTFRIAIEEGADDTRTLLYEPDLKSSGIDRRIELPGWNVKGFTLTASTRHYDTTFGDPTLTDGKPVEYAYLEAEVTVARSSLTGFLKLTAAVYVASVLALLSFLFQIDSGSIFSSRISFLAGSLFATVVNMRVASSELGSDDGLTLIDAIHIMVLLLIITATISTILADRKRRRAGVDTAAVRRFDLRNMAWCASVFVLANAALITTAVVVGRA